MTHAEAELKRLDKALEKYIADNFSDDHFGANAFRSAVRMHAPFVRYVLNDPTHSAERTALLNRFKHALGMELMAHEYIGVTLEGKGPVK